MNTDDIRFEVKIGTKDLFDFLITHANSKFTGILTIILSIVSLVFFFITLGQTDTKTSMLFLLGGLLYTVINPFMLYSKAKKQVLLNPAYKEKFDYIIGDSGITIQQLPNIMNIGWEEIEKVKETKKSILVYINPINAFVIPKACTGDELGIIIERLRNNVDSKKLKLKK